MDTCSLHSLGVMLAPIRLCLEGDQSLVITRSHGKPRNSTNRHRAYWSVDPGTQFG